VAEGIVSRLFAEVDMTTVDEIYGTGDYLCSPAPDIFSESTADKQNQ
jgi:hypothetical protein